MTDFEKALGLLLNHEGGLSDHAADRGGRTNYGVTQATFDAWRKGRGQPLADVATITGEQVKAIYRDNYWLAASCDKLPWPINYMTFDAAVNSGPARGIKWMQAGLGVDADGKVGPRTVQAANRAVCPEYLAIIKARADFIADLVQGQPSQRVFLKGWMRRLFDVYAKAMDPKA